MKKRKIIKNETKKGFTLVETSLSTALIAILLLAVALIVVNIVSIYRKGLTLKNLNSVGRTLVEDFNTTIAASVPSEVVMSSSGSTDTPTTTTYRDFSTYYYRNFADASLPKGAFCPGTYSYIWQNPSDESSIEIHYTLSGEGNKTIENFRLLKILDPEQLICSNLQEDTSSIDIRSGTVEDTNTALTYEPEEMLADTDIQLVVYNMVVSEVNSLKNLNQDLDTLSTEILFSGVITLGTKTGIENNQSYSSRSLSLDTEACNTSENTIRGSGVSTFDYCAVNRFKFAARAGSADV